jgi:hypothetical protein
VIERLWRGWTDPSKADAYEALLREEILPEIADTVGEGYRGHRILRREADGEVAFLTVLRFETMADVRALTGSDPESAHVPEAARDLLSRWEDTVTHYELREETTR